jgi:hypothetical protein
MGLSSEGPKPAPDARASESKGLVPGPKMTARTMREGENGGVGQNCGIRPKLGLHMSFSFFFLFLSFLFYFKFQHNIKFMVELQISKCPN